MTFHLTFIVLVMHRIKAQSQPQKFVFLLKFDHQEVQQKKVTKLKLKYRDILTTWTLVSLFCPS